MDKFETNHNMQSPSSGVIHDRRNYPLEKVSMDAGSGHADVAMGSNHDTVENLRRERNDLISAVRNISQQRDVLEKNLMNYRQALEDSEKHRMRLKLKFELLNELYLNLINNLIGGRNEQRNNNQTV